MRLVSLSLFIARSNSEFQANTECLLFLDVIQPCKNYVSSLPSIEPRCEYQRLRHITAPHARFLKLPTIPLTALAISCLPSQIG